MGESPPNWQWCQGATEEKRKNYLKKCSSVKVKSDKIECNNYCTSYFKEVQSDPEPNPNNKNLILTVGAGKIESLIQFSGPLFQEYAKRCDADFIFLTGQTQDYWGHEKFRINRYIPAYERTLFVDIDILIKRSAENIFEYIESDCVSMHDDRPFLHEKWGIKEKRKLLKSRFATDTNVIEKLATTKKIYNTGVVLNSKKHEKLWEPINYDHKKTHWDEQFQVEANCLHYKYKTRDLPTKFNCQKWMKNFDNLKESANFMHYAGDEKREESMKKDLELC
jgi:hypothetical protein